LSDAERPLIDLPALERWIGDRLPGSAEPLSAAQISGGASNEMFEVRRGGATWILRRPPRHKVSKSAHDMGREFRVLGALEGTAVPHPRPLLLCEEEAVLGAPFFLMERVDGFAPREPLPAPFDADPFVRREMGFALVDGIAGLAAVDWLAAGLEGFGRPEGFLERQVRRWLGQLETYRSRDIPGLDEVGRWLESERPPDGEPAILHGDYQLINVMFGNEPPARLAAIVDWEQSTIGDPLLDLGWLLAGWQDPGEDETRFTSAYFTDRRGLPTRAELARRYEEVSGRSLEHLGYYQVLALFKLACILEGSYHRFASGTSTLPVHEAMGPLVLKLARQASEQAGLA
jgi:aminoglycoside phosphotransferase (APT) family kinase protein